MIRSVPVQMYPFLSGGGTAGSLIKGKDWSQTALGSPGTWPASLCTTLSVLLQSPFPMLLFWGEAQYFFYNDAYAGIGGKNLEGTVYTPGLPAKQAWEHNWPAIEG